MESIESDKNRYWLAHDLLNSRYSDFHMAMYTYHRDGLDKLAEEPEDARFAITEALEGLKVFLGKSFCFFIKNIF